MKSDIEYLQTVIIPNTEGSMVISIKIVALVPDLLLLELPPILITLSKDNSQ
jgi:hypothetical protein